MSITLRCAVGRFRCPPNSPASITYAGRRIEDYFAEASSQTADGRPDIDLRMDWSTLGQTLESGSAAEATGPYWLHRAFRKLFGQPNESVPPNTVGLLLSGTFAPNPGLLGLMFASRFSSAGSYYAKPERVGAAVFLEAIAKIRPNPQEYEREVGFTAVHELGHLFNLWHVPAKPVSFMATSPLGSAYVPPVGFLDGHQQWLSKCSSSQYVLPGGSDFGDWGGQVSGPQETPSNRPGRAAKFRLRIGLSQPEFLPCEPVELDVRLTAVGVRRLIPNEIDPGYERCAIWIMEPDGECRRYRASLLYCHGGPSRVLEPGKPFERDIPIFGQAGGYTFRMAGVHRLHLTLALPGAGTIRSNEVEFLVRPWIARGKPGFARQALLASPQVASMLYYRAAGGREPGIRRLMDFCREASGDRAAGSAGYALGRMLLERGRTADRPADRRRHRQQAQGWLQRALKQGLNGVREQRAHRHLEELATEMG